MADVLAAPKRTKARSASSCVGPASTARELLEQADSSPSKALSVMTGRTGVARPRAGARYAQLTLMNARFAD